MNHADPALVGKKQHARDAAARERAAYLPQAVSERAAQRHADRPPELHGREVGSDDPPIFSRQASQPVENRFGPARRAKENNGYFG